MQPAKSGDKNTKFFHARASHRRKNNWIQALLDGQGVKRTEQKAIMDIVTSYFHNLFQSCTSASDLNWENHLQYMAPVIDEEMNDYLLSDISEEETRRAVFAQGPLKAPGIDGFPGFF
ncbi:hypothetical protein QQ045_010621 [Rhodiola kirilowii]